MIAQALGMPSEAMTVLVRDGKMSEAWHQGDEGMVMGSLGVKPPG